MKTMTIDGFYTEESAKNISLVVRDLTYIETEFGKEIENFNMVPQNANELFSSVLNKQVIVNRELSGVFRIPSLFIHFESFETVKDWLFVVALQPSTFNIFEHKSGATSALDKYQGIQYRNLFEWDLMVNHILKPGQGVFFRPWLFHSFDQGIVQMFRLQEK